MRIIDFKHAQDVDKFIANSQETQQRIKKFYRRDSIVVHPPVSLLLSSEQLFNIKQNSPQDYYFYIGRLGLQKHPELAVQACLKLGVKLKVAGTGQMLPQLKEIARDNKNIEFLGMVSDNQLAKLFAGAKGLLYPVEDEDFGIVPIEAMMAGTPVIAHRSGGLRFTVEEKVNGLFFEQLTISDLVKAIKEFESVRFSPKKIQQIAKQYSKERFKKSFQELIQEQKI